MCQRPVRLLLFFASTLGGLLIAPVAKSQQVPANSPPASATLLSEPERLIEAQNSYRQALAEGDSSRVAEACYLLSKRYSNLGDFEAAQKWSIRCERILEPRGPSAELAKLYIQLAGIATATHRYRDAYGFVHRSLTMAKQIHSDHAQMSAYTMLSGLHSANFINDSTEKKNVTYLSFDSTFYYNRLAEKLARKLRDPKEVAIIQLNTGSLWMQRDVRRAIPYFQKAMAFYKARQVFYSVAIVHLCLARAYVRIRQFTNARHHLDQTQFLRQQHDLKTHDLLENLADVQATYAAATGDWKRAYQYLEEHQRLKNKALTMDREGAVSRLGVAYETEKKEAQLKAQNEALALRTQNLTTQKRLTLITGIFLGITGVMSVIFFRLYRKNKRISLQNAALVMEQSHRFRNNLQVVTSLLSLHANRVGDPVAQKAVQESRLRVESMSRLHQRLYVGPRLVEVDLAEFIQELVGEVLYNYGYSNLEPTYTLEPIWLHVDKAVPLGLILTELVSNACKYAFVGQDQPALTITCHQTEGRIHLRIADNGPGFVAKPTSESFGLTLIGIQVQQLKGINDFINQNGLTFLLSFKP
ncbi:histidine kinase dimerization/phosphoacceptor domain -containing protein [Larkinella bovis]|uniref:Histidine kinase dimerization/phosphoacceptor domain -containing protein n=1 Tax=Larkinella bovis TaxID=683041 RepID=A0ABW0IH40_9BACT